MTWQNAWIEGRTGWDAGASPPVLVELVESGALPTGRILVPGCGAGYDLLTLAGPDREVIGIDVAPAAAERFEALKRAHGIRRGVDYRVTDFFAFEPEAKFDLVWDYTFLCALDPSMRSRWSERMHELLTEDGEIVALIFPVDPVPLNPGGPPYPMTPELVVELLAPAFEPHTLEPVVHSHPGRQGKEWLGRFRRRP
jgi:methyl halide transferase